MEQSNQKKLIAEILKHSNSPKWEYAKLEWDLKNIFQKDNHCVCGHEINDNCVIENIHNGNKMIVGNVCVEKFLPIKSKSIFDGLKRIINDKSKSTSKKMLEYCYLRKILNQWEYEFYNNIHKKRKLTEKQKKRKFALNYKIIRSIKNDN